MPRVVKRSASQAVKSGPSRRGAALPQFVTPQLSQPVEKPPSGPQWLHEIKLDGYRMAARIDNGRVRLLTRTGLDWTDKYPSAIEALANLKVKTAYIDGELCGVDEAGLPSFAHTQAATDGERGVHLVYYAFDLLHLDGWDVSDSSSARRFWSRCSQTSRAFSSTAMRPATANSSSSTPASSDLRAWSPRRSTRHMRPEIAAYGAKPNG
jgi:ATP-dependent DNA ligase